MIMQDVNNNWSRQNFLYEGGQYQHRISSVDKHQNRKKLKPTFEPMISTMIQQQKSFFIKSRRQSLEWGGSSHRRDQKLNLDNFDEHGHYIHQMEAFVAQRPTPRSTSVLESNIVKILSNSADPKDLKDVLNLVRIKYTDRSSTSQRSNLAQKIIIKKKDVFEELPQHSQIRSGSAAKPVQTFKYIGVHNDQIGILSRKVTLESYKMMKRYDIFIRSIAVVEEEMYSFSKIINKFLILQTQESENNDVSTEVPYFEVSDGIIDQNAQKPNPQRYDQFVINNYVIPRRLKVGKKV